MITRVNKTLGSHHNIFSDGNISADNRVFPNTRFITDYNVARKVVVSVYIYVFSALRKKQLCAKSA